MFHRGVTRQLLAVTAGSLSIMNVGIMLGWTSPILEELLGPNSPIPMSIDQGSWFVTVHNVGVILGSVPFGMMADRWGRKPCLQAIGPLALVTWTAVLYVDTVPELLAVRVAQGLLIAGAYTVVPVYVGEVAGPQIRGALGTMFQIMMYVGILLVYTAGTFLDYQKLTYVVIASQAAVLCALFAGIPESPYYYAINGRPADAKRTLAWLQGMEKDCGSTVKDGGGAVKDDGGAVKDGGGAVKDGGGAVKTGGGGGDSLDVAVARMSEDARGVSVAQLFTDPVSVRSLLIVQGMSVFRVMVGVVVIISYASITFTEMNVDADSNALSVAFACVLLVSTLLATALADHAGRRPLMIGSCLLCAMFNAAACAYFYLAKRTAYDVSAYGWLCAVTVSCLSVAYSMGPGSLFSIINCELFPSNTRSTANAVTTVTLTVVAFLATRAYPLVAVDGGMYRNYLMYAVCSFAAAAFFWLWLPETKGKTLAAIQDQLKSDAGVV